MSTQKDAVRRFTDGFRMGDLDGIVSCLAPDVVWVLHDDKTLVGRDAFAAEADNGGGPAPDLHLDRLIEEGDTVAVVGHGSVVLDAAARACAAAEFVYSEVFTFTDGLVSRLDTFRIWLERVAFD